jgi:hypothetical protein
VCGEYSFRILDTTGSEVGSITKKWGGVAIEAMTDADNFHVVFPPQADPRARAILLSSVFLIDMMYFENSDKKTTDNF